MSFMLFLNVIIVFDQFLLTRHKKATQKIISHIKNYFGDFRVWSLLILARKCTMHYNHT